MRPRRLAAERKAVGRAFRQIPAQRRDRARAGARDHVARARRIERGHRRARRHRFQQHQSERVRQAREHEHVRARITGRQFVAELRAEEHHVLVLALQLFQLRAFADDHLGARQRQVSKRLDILFDRHTPDIQENRPRHPGKRIARLAFLHALQRRERLGIHAPAPGHEIGEAVILQLLHQRRRRHHHLAGILVEPAHEGIAPAHRHRQARGNIFRKPRVIGGGEGVLLGQAHRPRRHPQRAFGRDMHRVRLELVEDVADPRPAPQAHLDLGIGRQRHRHEARAGVHDLPDMPHRLGLGDDALHRAHDAVDLGIPGVSHEHDAHGISHWTFHRGPPRAVRGAMWRGCASA